MAKTRNHALPSVAAYRRALSTVAPLHRNHVALLTHHLRSHRHTVTATHLAKLVGYRSYRAVNLQYGRLGKRLGDALGAAYKPPAGAQASYSIATFLRPDEDHPDWEWKMHGPLVEALRESTLLDP